MRLILVIAAFLVLSLETRAQQIVPVTDWFRVSTEQNDGWTITTSDADRVTIAPKVAPPTKPKRIAVIYPRASSAYDVAISTILETFLQRDVVVDMDIRVFRNNLARGAVVLKETLDSKPDLILAMGSEAVDFIYDNYKGGKIPVVTVCAKDPVSLGQMPDYERGSGTNYAFTSLNMPVEVQMAYLVDLKPGLKNISILVDAKNTSAIETQERPIAEAARRRGMNVIDGLVRDPAAARQELDQLIPAALREMRRTDPELKNSVFIITGSTAVFREIRAISELAKRVPVLSLVPEVVQAGDDSAALSIGISFESNARLAASYILQTLESPARVGQLKVGIVSPPDISINFRKTREIGLRIPFALLEAASFVYDHDGKAVRVRGQLVKGDRASPSG